MQKYSAVCSLALILALGSLPVTGQVAPWQGARPVSRITSEVDETRRVVLEGTRTALAEASMDQGTVDAGFRVERMILTLKPSPEQQAALDALTEAQQIAGSSDYHHWLTPKEFESHFGVSAADIQQICAWLRTHHFTVDSVPAGNRSIVFSGTALELEQAFHVLMHRYLVSGETRHANLNDPEIPEAFAQVIAGISTLNDFPRAHEHHTPDFTNGGAHYLAPADFAAIYDATPAYASGTKGAGQTIAIVGRTGIRSSDVTSFRSRMGLPANAPTVTVNGRDPGIISNDEETEADLDVEWSGAVAPSATVNFVVSASTSATDGVDLSAQYAVTNNVAPIVSVSFGSCEAQMGSSELGFYNSLWQQASSQGISVFVAAGDSGAAGCDNGNRARATGVRAVNGLCSSPYSTCVGGTEFNEGGSPALYWASSTDSATQASALSYIPEVAWNESGSVSGGSGLWATGGGASVNYLKPVWQSGPGVPNDGYRDVPDVALSAAGHDAYLIVQEGQLMAVSGTSAAAPSFAGLMALVDQKSGGAQGNANPKFYALAAGQDAGGPPVFHTITGGNNTVPGVIGFTVGPNYNQVTGLGSVDANVLVSQWSDTGQAPGWLTITGESAATIVAGAGANYQYAVTPPSSFNALVTLAVAGMPPGISAVFNAAVIPAPGNGSATLAVAVASGVAPGVYPLSITASGGNMTATTTLVLTITPTQTAPFTLSANPGSLSMQQGATTPIAVLVQPAKNFNGRITMNAAVSAKGIGVIATGAQSTPAGTVFSYSVTVAGSAAPGSYSVAFHASSGATSTNVAVPLTVAARPSCTLTLSASQVSLTRGGSAPIQVSCSSPQGSVASSLQLKASGVPNGITAVFSPASIAAGGAASTLTLTASATALAGSGRLMITATNSTLSVSTLLAVAVTAPPSISVSALPAVVQIPLGGKAQTMIHTEHAGAFDSAITLSLNGIPGGVTPALTSSTVNAPGDGFIGLSLAVAPMAATGTYTMTIQASGGTLMQSVALTVVILPAPSFSINAPTQTLSIVPGRSVTEPLSVSRTSGFSSPVQFSAAAASGAALPQGMAIQFSMGSAISAPAILTVTTTTSTPAGSYPIVVSATGGGITKTLNMTLAVGSGH